VKSQPYDGHKVAYSVTKTKTKRMKPKHQIQTTALAALAVLALATTMAHAQYYGAPSGGWGYIYNGTLGAAGSGGTAFDSLDGTWNHSSASLYGVGPGDSDNWDGSGLGSGAPGGVQTGTAGSTTYLRIQDAGNSSAFPNPNNSSIAFGHNLTANGFSDLFMNSGVTLAFRIRVPTGAGLDARTSALGGTSPYPTTIGDGYGTFGNGLGELYVKNNANSVSGGARVGAIGFSLGSASEDWPTISGNTGFPNNTNGGAFLYMQNLTADVLNNQSDTGEAPASGQNVANRLAVNDPTQWNEFWINIAANDATPGNGTHTVRIWKNGELTYTDFNVTAGNNNQDYQAMASMGIALAYTEGSGALDVDYFAVKEGIYAPSAIPEPSTLGLGVLGLLAMAGRFGRFRRN
jgi:hypothetical protein